MTSFKNTDVEETFGTYPPAIRKKLMALRKLIFKIATATPGVGSLEETLKWGEPAYLTSKSKSGSTIRIAWKNSRQSEYAMYFHCQTRLIETFRTLFPNEFRFEGNRAIIFDQDDDVPLDSLGFCIAAALTYHLKK
jgi:hypothetical protein